MSILVNGLAFFDNTLNVSWRNRVGSPDLFAGRQYAENSTPLYFDYLSTESITSFKAIKIDNNANSFYEYTLDTSLIQSTGSHHICSGTVNYSQALQQGYYYFVVNDRYESELWQVLELDNGAWVLETGIYENGCTIWTADGIWGTI